MDWAYWLLPGFHVPFCQTGFNQRIIAALSTGYNISGIRNLALRNCWSEFSSLCKVVFDDGLSSGEGKNVCAPQARTHKYKPEIQARLTPVSYLPQVFC